MKRKRVSKTKKFTNKRIVVIIPQEIKEQFPEVIKQLTSLSPKQRGKLIVYTILMAGMAFKEPNLKNLANITVNIPNMPEHTDKQQEKKLEPIKIKDEKIEGVEKL